MPDRTTCLAAVRARDTRFDGQFFTAVSSTGIYCRPSCPAMTPRDDRMTFHPSAASAQAAGFRACRRCRPDTVPGTPDWDVRGDAVARFMRLVGDGVLDRDGVAGAAGRLGWSVRQLERLTLAELGATPVALARAQRAHTARVLLETTDWSMADVAHAAGFGSIRSFNDVLSGAYATTPRALRARVRQAPSARTPAPPTRAGLGVLRVRLSFRAPFNPSNVFGHLAATAVPGVEEWRDGAYRRTLRLPHGPGIVALAPAADHVAATVWLTDPRDLTPAIARCRRLLDLDADPVAVDAALGADRALEPLVAVGPGRRVPRTVDPDELALRAVIGQQVSTAAARTHAGRLVQRYGTPVDDPAGGLSHLFPTPADLAEASPDALAGPAARAATLRRLAAALADGRIDLSPGSDWSAARAALAALPGLGPWTVEMIAMRALGDPDAFPATDLGVRRALDALGVTPAGAARWRPWRSYATQYLWATSTHPVNRLPADQPEEQP